MEENELDLLQAAEIYKSLNTKSKLSCKTDLNFQNFNFFTEISDTFGLIRPS